jgi:hypothetical protein
MAKTFSIAVAALLISGSFALFHPAAAHDISSYAYQRADYAGAGLYAGPFYDAQVSRNNTDYYLTSSPFCPPDGSNAYNGGFATLAYGVNGRPAGYVCR